MRKVTNCERYNNRCAGRIFWRRGWGSHWDGGGGEVLNKIVKFRTTEKYFWQAFYYVWGEELGRVR